MTCRQRVQCLCIPAHSGAGLNDQRLSLARSALPASLPWVLQSELQTAEPFRFPQGSSERGWGHGVRLQSQPVRQKPGKVKIGQHLFWKARQLLWYVKNQSPRRSKVKRYLSLLFDFSLVPDPSLVLHSTLWDRKPSGWKRMRDFFCYFFPSVFCQVLNLYKVNMRLLSLLYLGQLFFNWRFTMHKWKEKDLQYKNSTTIIQVSCNCF